MERHAGGPRGRVKHARTGEKWKDLAGVARVE